MTSADGVTFGGDYLVLAMGTEPNFFHTPGAEEHAFPLYSVDDAERLRSRLLTVLEDAHRDPSSIDRGALNFVIVGAGATGVETAGALADCINRLIPKRLGARSSAGRDPPRRSLPRRARTVLRPRARVRAKVLEQRGVQLELGTKVDEVRADRVVLSDGREILTRTVVWAGGIKIPEFVARSGLPDGAERTDRGRPRPRGAGVPGVYALGDVANTLDGDGKPFPQLGSVALQAGRCAADNIVADIAGKATHAVPLPRQGDHGDDRPQRGDRRGRPAPPRAARLPGVHVVARRARLAAQRLPRPGQRARLVDVGLRRRASGRRPTSTGRTPPRSTGTSSAWRASRRAVECRFRGEPAVELAAGDLTAVFTPGLGMTGVSLRYRGGEYLALPGGLDALRSGRTGGLPLLAPWANRLRGRRYRAAGVTVAARRPGPAGRRQRPADPRVPRRRARLVGRPALDARATPPALRASIAVDAPAFPFPHRIEVTAIVREPTLAHRHHDRPDRSPGSADRVRLAPVPPSARRRRAVAGGSGCRRVGTSRSTTAASPPVTSVRSRPSRR